MEYRDQLKYIKSHQTTGGERRPERNRGKKPAKPSFLNRVLVFVQAVSAVVLFGSMAILGILPMKYMAGLLVLLVLLLLVVKRKQKRAFGERTGHIRQCNLPFSQLLLSEGKRCFG